MVENPEKLLAELEDIIRRAEEGIRSEYPRTVEESEDEGRTQKVALYISTRQKAKEQRKQISSGKNNPGRSVKINILPLSNKDLTNARRRYNNTNGVNFFTDIFPICSENKEFTQGLGDGVLGNKFDEETKAVRNSTPAFARDGPYDKFTLPSRPSEFVDSSKKLMRKMRESDNDAGHGAALLFIIPHYFKYNVKKIEYANIYCNIIRDVIMELLYQNTGFSLAHYFVWLEVTQTFRSGFATDISFNNFLRAFLVEEIIEGVRYLESKGVEVKYLT